MRNKIITLFLYVSICLKLFFISTPLAHATSTPQEFTFNTTAIHSPNTTWNYSAAAGTTMTEDTLLTRIEINTSDLPVDTAVDSGIAVYGPNGLAYGDVISLTGSRRERGGSINFVVDLGATPLFVPKGFSINPVLTFYSKAQGTFTMSGKVTYRTYLPGDTRYITLVLPFMDQLTLNGALPDLPYYFISNTTFPLKVRAVNAFVSFGGSVLGEKYAYICLQWHHGTTKVTEQCLPHHHYPPDGHYQSLAPISLNWDVPPGDTLTAVSSGEAQDIQLNLLIEVPSNFTNSPYLVTHDFGHVPDSVLSQYCQNNLAYYGNTQDRLSQCLALYPNYPIPSDLNTDGSVNLFDYNLVVSGFGNPYTIFDYNTLVANYGK